MFAAGTTAVNVVGFFTALLSFRGFGAPRAYRLKASNACLSFQHSAGQRPCLGLYEITFLKVVHSLNARDRTPTVVDSDVLHG
jgi:hypothetical protein